MAKSASRARCVTFNLSLAVFVTCGVGCDDVPPQAHNDKRPPVASIGAKQDSVSSRNTRSDADGIDSGRTVIDPLVTLPTLKNRFYLVVPVMMDGKQFSFVLDTGSERHVFDISLRDKLGTYRGLSELFSPGGRIIVENYEAPDAMLGTIPLGKLDPVACFDLEPLRKGLDCDIRGIIGMPLFRRFIVQLDWDNDAVQIFRPTTMPDADWGEPIRMWEKDGTLEIEGTFDTQASVGARTTHSAPFFIDTGQYEPLKISDRHTRSLREAKQITFTGEREFFTIGGKLTRKQGFLRTLRIVPFEHHNLRFTQAERCAVGLRYLSRYRVTFDLPNDRVFLKPGRRYVFRYDLEPSGLYYRDEHTHFVVTDEEPDTPAYRAGIRAGDHILKAAGRAVTDFRDITLRVWMERRQGAPITLICRRDDKIHEFTFRLREESVDYDAPHDDE